MEEEEVRPKASASMPRNLENLSVDELEEYKRQLLAEIERVDAEKQRKQAMRAAADSFFNV